MSFPFFMELKIPWINKGLKTVFSILDDAYKLCQCVQFCITSKNCTEKAKTNLCLLLDMKCKPFSSLMLSDCFLFFFYSFYFLFFEKHGLV